MSFLNTYGYSQYFFDQWDPSNAGLKVAKIISVNRQQSRMASEQGELIGKISGRFSFTAVCPEDYPNIGDWVLYRDAAEGEQNVIIERVLDRQSTVKRKTAGTQSASQLIACNVDTVFIVQSCNQDINMRRIERYLVACHQEGLKTVLLLNKCDLLKEPLNLEIPTDWELPLHFVSAVSGAGREEIESYFTTGQTSVLIGSSGVGKSTLINSLGNNVEQATQGIRRDDDKGRHTTTSRDLFFTKTGGMIIDTPGMREFGLIDTDIEGSGLFEDIDRLAKQCKFRNCHHTNEPGCAVRASIEAETLDPRRLKSMQKLQREELFQQQRNDKKVAYDTKKRWKAVTMQMRKHPKKPR